MHKEKRCYVPTSPASRAAERIRDIMKREFGNEATWSDGHSLGFLLNCSLFDVIVVLNAPEPAMGCDEPDAYWRDYEVSAEELRADFLTLCTTLNRMKPDQQRSGQTEHYDSGFRCSECNAAIREGEPMWSINIKYETCDNGVLTVEYGEIISVYCETCAGNRGLTPPTSRVKHAGPDT